MNILRTTLFISLASMLLSSCGGDTPEPPVTLDGSWIELTAPTFSARQDVISFVINNMAYIGMGKDASGFKTDFYSFDGTTWDQVANFPGGGRTGVVSFVVDNKGYVGLGQKFDGSSEENFDDLWEYNPSSNTWQQKASHPAGARHQAIGFGVGNNGYVATGQNANSTRYKDVWQYNPTNDAWIQKIDFPGGERILASTTNILGKGFLFGGLGYKDVWEYSEDLDVWSKRADFDGELRRKVALFTIGNKSYFGLGFEDGTYYTDFWKFDYHANLWVEQKSFKGNGRSGTIGFSIGDNGYILMGGSLNELYDDFWEFTP